MNRQQRRAQGAAPAGRIDRLVQEVYAAHCILCNLGFEPDDIWVMVGPVLNTDPGIAPGTLHVIVKLEHPERTFTMPIHPVTEAEGQAFKAAYELFSRQQPHMPRARLDHLLYTSETWQRKTEMLWALTRKGFELRPGHMAN